MEIVLFRIVVGFLRVGGSHPRFPRRNEDVVRVQHVLPELPVLRVPGRAQAAREVLVSAALEAQVFHQIVPHLVRPAALVARERFGAPEVAVPRPPGSGRLWKIERKTGRQVSGLSQSIMYLGGGGTQVTITKFVSPRETREDLGIVLHSLLFRDKRLTMIIHPGYHPDIVRKTHFTGSNRRFRASGTCPTSLVYAFEASKILGNGICVKQGFCTMVLTSSVIMLGNEQVIFIDALNPS